MDNRYPIGPFTWTGPYTPQQRTAAIDDIAATPRNLRDAVAGLTDSQLDTPYRDGGWSIRQVIHHLSDSHSNASIRLRLALTEHEPTIKPYDQRWAELTDAKSGPIEPSLGLMDGLHYRLAMLLRSLSDADVTKKFNHPEIGVVTIDRYVATYSWHGKHHVAQITSLRERKGW